MKLTSRSSTFWNSLLEEWFWISVILERLVWATTPATASLGGIGSWHDDSPINIAMRSVSNKFGYGNPETWVSKWNLLTQLTLSLGRYHSSAQNLYTNGCSEKWIVCIDLCLTNIDLQLIRKTDEKCLFCLDVQYNWSKVLKVDQFVSLTD